MMTLLRSSHTGHHMSYFIQIRVQWDGSERGHTTTVSPSHQIGRCTDPSSTLRRIIWSDTTSTRVYKTREGAQRALDRISLGQVGRALLTGQVVREDGQSAHNIWRS